MKWHHLVDATTSLATRQRAAARTRKLLAGAWRAALAAEGRMADVRRMDQAEAKRARKAAKRLRDARG